MRSVWISLLCVAALVGCKADKDPPRSAVDMLQGEARSIKLDLSTPDLAVKSWWALKDNQASVEAELCQDTFKALSVVSARMKEAHAQPDHVWFDCRPKEQYSRVIEKVQIESESRAVVFAVVKNATPPDPNAVLSSSERSSKDAGQRYRYTLTHPSSGTDWKIEQVDIKYSWSDEWESVYSPPEPYKYIYIDDLLQ